MAFLGVYEDGLVGKSLTPANISASPIVGVFKLSATLTPVSVAAATTAEQTFTFTGVRPGDVVTVNKPTAQAGLGIAGCRVTANDTVGITFINATAGAITPTAAESYTLLGVR